MNYCKTANQNITLEAIKDVVKEQWLLVNLRNIRVPSLPPNLLSCSKKILTGKYMVQVESMIDCARSCYSQFQELLRINVENIEATVGTQQTKDWNVKPNRCLVFTISDGVQELKAMEYKPLSKIRTNDPELLPGFKMLIIGPVECRKGMIMLQNENIMFCGGEVDTLTSSNNLRSLLIRRLDLNETDFPPDNLGTNNVRRDSILNCNESRTTEMEQEIKSCANAESLLSQGNEIFLHLPLEYNQDGNKINEGTRPNACTVIAGVNNLNSERNQFFEEIDTHELHQDTMSNDNISLFGKHTLPLEEVCLPTPKKMSLSPSAEIHDSSSKSKHVIKQQNRNNDKPINETNRIKPTHKKTKGSIQTDLSSFFTCHTSYENSLVTEIEENQTVIPQNLSQSKFISQKPFVYLKQIMSRTISKELIFTIKGTILTLKKKIMVQGDKYNLTGTITDGSLAIDADFSSPIIEKLLEYSPCEMQAMLKAKELNPVVGDRIKDTFKKAQEKFISLNCLMKIKFYPNSKIPLILSLEEVTTVHLNALKGRIKSFV
ncbi:hypothetical protein RUM43_009466 [Polyplax serrata]|uniref:RecQ-mediated genome instability protein 1 n=1 Tax=Polyplax serrata TaxID=468196 RepID=A0AAN8RUG0_POLSC